MNQIWPKLWDWVIRKTKVLLTRSWAELLSVDVLMQVEQGEGCGRGWEKGSASAYEKDLVWSMVELEGFSKRPVMNIFINTQLTLRKIQRENKPRIIDDSLSPFVLPLKSIVNQQIQKLMWFLPSALTVNQRANNILKLGYQWQILALCANW